MGLEDIKNILLLILMGLFSGWIFMRIMELLGSLLGIRRLVEYLLGLWSKESELDE